MKRSTQILVALVGMLLISFAMFTGMAVATPTPSFTVSPTQPVVGSPVTLTDTTSNPDGYTLSYEWKIEGAGFDRWVKAGDPLCANSVCSQVQVTFSQSGSVHILEAVIKEGTTYPYTSWIGSVAPASDPPAPITLVGPTAVSLPTVLEVLSPKNHLQLNNCRQPALAGSVGEYCKAYLVKRVGPDAVGLYHYRLQLAVVAGLGDLTIEAVAWNAARNANAWEVPGYADRQSFNLNVVGNSLTFGLVRSCRGSSGYGLYFFATMNTEVVAQFQIKEAKHWVTKRTKRKTFLNSALSPWGRRYFQAKPASQTSGRNRVSYEIKHGRKVLKKGIFSEHACPVLD